MNDTASALVVLAIVMASPFLFTWLLARTSDGKRRITRFIPHLPQRKSLVPSPTEIAMRELKEEMGRLLKTNEPEEHILTWLLAASGGTYSKADVFSAVADLNFAPETIVRRMCQERWSVRDVVVFLNEHYEFEEDVTKLISLLEIYRAELKFVRVAPATMEHASGRSAVM